MAPKMEFYLTKRSDDSDYPLQAPMGHPGRQETGRQSFSIDATNELDPLSEDMCNRCEAQGLDLNTLVHEEGTTQMEVNFRHGDALDLTDQILVFKRAMRRAAFKHNAAVTFMIKPMTGESGNAMYLHQSIVDVRTGESILSNAGGTMSELFLRHVGGLQKLIPEVLPLFTPNMNSFHRFLLDTLALVNVEWGEENHTVGLCVSDSSPENRRIESRPADADVDPYLALTASLLCGCVGVVEGTKSSVRVEGCGYEHHNLCLPLTVEAALERMGNCKPLE